MPSIVRLEGELIGCVHRILNAGNDVSGVVTSGGTESIFLALKSARDSKRDRITGALNAVVRCLRTPRSRRRVPASGATSGALV